MATGGEGRQEAEVGGLWEQFPGRCRVLSQLGEYSHVVTLQPPDRQFTIKFLLKESYPDSPPDVVVRSASLGAEQVQQLEQELREGAGSRLGRPMLAELLALAEAWLSQAGVKQNKEGKKEAKDQTAAWVVSPSPRDEKSHSEQPGFNAHRTDKPRATHFLAVRVRETAVWSVVRELEDFMVSQEPLYRDCCYSQAELHVTLCTLGLDTPQQVEGAAQALQDLQADLQQRCPRSPLRIHGVSDFFGRVVYAKVEEDPALLEFVDFIRKCMRSAGIDIREYHEFVPHMTIMKVSPVVARRKRMTNVNWRLYRGYGDMHFGSQDIEGLSLCTMGKERGEDGFWVCPAEVSF